MRLLHTLKFNYLVLLKTAVEMLEDDDKVALQNTLHLMIQFKRNPSPEIYFWLEQSDGLMTSVDGWIITTRSLHEDILTPGHSVRWKVKQVAGALYMYIQD